MLVQPRDRNTSLAPALTTRVAAPMPAPPASSAAFSSPRELRSAIPRSFTARALVEGTRDRVRRVLHGEDRERLLVVVGPCSIHSCEAALEYAEGVRRIARETSGSLVILMRTYFEKPRTRGGWKGLLNDPHLDGSCDVATGLRRARRLLLDLNEMGVACATEFLDPLATPYLEDLVSWAAIGARTSESQTHRELASRLAMPVGFKNTTDGRLEPAHDAVVVARQPHSSLVIADDGQPAIRETAGNPDAHLVLRGGGGAPNCDGASLAEATESARSLGLARPLLVDCSHDNSGRVPERQIDNALEVVREFTAGLESVAGLMLESNLQGGSQRLPEQGLPAAGISITDPCIDWNETARLLRVLDGELTRARR